MAATAQFEGHAARRDRLLREELANAITHGAGLALSLVGFAVLVALAAMRGGMWRVISCGVYGASLVALYASSTIYHLLRAPHWKRIFRVLDHCAIYLLIAGTYTPFTIVVLGGSWGWTLLGAVWGLTFLGIAFQASAAPRFPTISVATYVLLGWTVVIAIKPLMAHAPLAALLWLLAGGIAYTGGIAFYAARRLPYHHAVWHVCVLAGSACHFVAVLTSVLPRRG